MPALRGMSVRCHCCDSVPARSQTCVVVGGLDMQQQAKELARRPHVVVATPGRLRVRHHFMAQQPGAVVGCPAREAL